LEMPWEAGGWRGAGNDRGPFLRRLWLVNENGTRTASPKLNGIVDVVLGIAPDGGKSRSARGSGSGGQRPLLLAQADKINKILDLGDTLGGQRRDFLDQGLGVGGMPVLSGKLLDACYNPTS
jgi:hypothetical protein